MKTIRLFFDMEFTSLSPDAQIISLGIVSENSIIGSKITIDDLSEEGKSVIMRGGKNGEVYIPEYFIIKKKDNNNYYQLDFPITDDAIKRCGYGTGINRVATIFTEININPEESKSFYSEFSDFNIERCDDWVKENVVSKLKYIGTKNSNKMFIDSSIDEGTYFGSQNTSEIKEALYRWLKQFSDYQIEFIGDCCTYDWFYLLQLIGEWELERKSYDKEVNGNASVPDYWRVGLPKLPSNITPVPFDLNDLIAIKKGISVKDAFNLDREMLGLGFFEHEVSETMYKIGSDSNKICENKHNSLWDAKVIKSIYEKLC